MTEQNNTEGLRPQRRKTTHTVGEWSWNHPALLSRIQPGTTENSCSEWLGSQGRDSGLFGGFKNGRAQMTQARRLIYSGEYNEDIREHSIRLTCHNSGCVNIKHMEKAVNFKLFKGCGIEPAQPKPKPEPGQRIKKRTARAEQPGPTLCEELERW